MPFRLLVFGCLAVSATLAASSTATRAQTRSVFDGVYTIEQAERGKRQYVRDCAECHGATLAGAEGGSALVGKDFLSHWEKKSVGELFDLVRKTMPDSSPGALTERQYLDIVAYVLKENSFPAGKDELVRTETMNAIAFVRR